MGENLDCHLDDGGTEISAIEAADSTGHRQSLHVRVGPVFYGDDMAVHPGIWVEYQNEHYDSDIMGPVLLTPEVWRELNTAVEDNIRKTKLSWWRQWVRNAKYNLRLG